MKLKMVIATLVCGMAFCSTSYGFDLLNRMMGRSGCGGCATSCCDTPAVASCGGGCNKLLDFDIHIRFSLGCPQFGNFFNRGGGGCGLLGGGGGCGLLGGGCGLSLIHI